MTTKTKPRPVKAKPTAVKRGGNHQRDPLADQRRVPSGIVGLDEVMEGGFRPHTVTVIVGASGTGKSTFAMQYLLEGLDNGEQALYITLDVQPKQIVQESVLWGWDRMEDYVDKSLFFFATSGNDFKAIIDEQLPALVEARREYQTPTRVVIDPLTPIIWAEREKSVQRELIGNLFNTLKEIGSVLATVEEHGESEDGAGATASTPIFLADSAIHLRYQPIGGAFNRTLEIVKMRGTRHGEEVYPYIFARGVGAIVRTTPIYDVQKARGHEGTFEQAISAAKREDASPVLIASLEKMRDNWAYDYSPKEALEKVLRSHHIERKD